jgi:hypothetical protein
MVCGMALFSPRLQFQTVFLMRVFIGGPTNSARDIDTYNVPQKSRLHDSKSVQHSAFPDPRQDHSPAERRTLSPLR